MLFFLLFSITSIPFLVMGQSDAPSFNDDTNDTMPIDGGLSLLVIAGLGYGAKKMKERKEIRPTKN